ncbi:hypothetical protein ACFOLJ_30660 [Rugamonas sp. CCM 8940]|uniref:hypothetical protein n=1 Tax=Rugamonas sp. CCM 8940 TaxID=2765359 RepID=UPI0018F501E2|nr:hypothetical protein [Rugamonas sp. CCM 8940]MBJ7309287.1 hypothetical protein [Rugamonas sp. CCM 8940]
MSLPTDAPASGADLEALADHLSAAANALHARLLRALRQPTAGTGTGAGAGAAALSQPQAQAMFEDEVALRQSANGLYLDAARLAASGLGGAQQELLALTARAGAQIAHLEHIRELADLAAELVALAGAVVGGKPEHIPAPLEKIRRHLAALDQAGPGSAPAPA